jgi:integrase/recombinase XerD
MGMVERNPAVQVQRPRVNSTPPRGLTTWEIKRLLRAVPETPAGVRDRAIILFAVFTGRRRSEILALRRGDLVSNGGRMFYTYRGKGGELHRRELPEPVLRAILAALDARGTPFGELQGQEERLFNVSAHGFYLNLRRHLRKAKLPETGVHVLRHSAAKLRRDAGESVEQVSRFLDHSSLAVTTTYLRRLEGEGDAGWPGVARLLDL